MRYHSAKFKHHLLQGREGGKTKGWKGMSQSSVVGQDGTLQPHTFSTSPHKPQPTTAFCTTGGHTESLGSICFRDPVLPGVTGSCNLSIEINRNRLHFSYSHIDVETFVDSSQPMYENNTYRRYSRIRTCDIMSSVSQTLKPFVPERRFHGSLHRIQLVVHPGLFDGLRNIQATFQVMEDDLHNRSKYARPPASS